VKLPSMFSVRPGVGLDPDTGLPIEIVRQRDRAIMVLIPAGRFRMGTPEREIPELVARFGRIPEAYRCEIPQRTVILDAFYIDKYEVTNEMYQRFCKSTDHQWPKHWVNGEYKADERCHPVRNVNWYDANAYASWAGVSLPTEAQWEKAARGTDGRLFPWGNEADYCRVHYLRLEYYQEGDGLAVPNVDRCLTAEVGSYPQGASPYGVMDMLGNVWEWCMDWFDCSYYAWSPSTNPKGPRIGEERVLKGCGSLHDLHKLRCAYRYSAKPDTPHTELFGFRCSYDPLS